MIMTDNPVRWFEIYVQDMARARAFYEAVFEVKLEKLESPGMEMWTFPMLTDGMGAGGGIGQDGGGAIGRRWDLGVFRVR
jgi:predicted enzyme related to lactoylglutathione lyase